MKNMKFGIQPKNEVINLEGPSHEEQGISMGNNIEAEGQESMIGNFMFSNRLIKSDNKSFSDVAKKIESKYKKDKSTLALKSKKLELSRLAEEQEQLKQSMIPNNQSQQEPQQMAYGGSTKKMALGGVMLGAQLAGGAINMARGAFEKPRQYDDISLERSNWQDASFDKVNFEGVDYSEQRNLAGLNTERNRLMGNATIRNNASSSGQLLGNTLFNNARNLSSLNRNNRESFMNEENTNTQIQNQENQYNVGTANQFSQFNTQGQNQTNQFNTQIGNQEAMQNFQIGMQNDANRDAKRQMMWDGFGQMLNTGANYAQDQQQRNFDTNLMNRMYPNVYGNPKPFGNISPMSKRGPSI